MRQWDVPAESCTVTDIKDLLPAIARFRPDVIVTTGFFPGELNAAGYDLRKKWMNVSDPKATPEAVAQSIQNVYINNIWTAPKEDDVQPLVSVYTPTFNTGGMILDTYYSLRDQTYPNWEWVVVDDGSTDGTYERLLEFAKIDHRVRPIKVNHIGKVGALKDMATRLCTGVYLIELDHDDMLTRDAVYDVAAAFKSHPEAGMVYTNCASFFQDGSPHTFPEWVKDGRYREFEYNGKKYMEAVNPNIYDRFGPEYYKQFGWFLTVGPNHIRAYRAKTFRELGGYNPQLAIADDWDLYARFFLRSKCFHLDKCLYLYRFLDAFQNTTFTKNKAIQDNLEIGRNNYRHEFEEFNNRRHREGCISIVVLDWNTPELTKRCLESVKKHYPTLPVILLNNGSKVPVEGPATKVINLEANIGYAAGCNRAAMEVTSPYICFLNSDTVVEPGVLDRLLIGLNDSQATAVVGPYSNYACPPQGYVQKEDAFRHGSLVVDSVVGVCMMTRTDMFKKLGGFDTRFVNFEDTDYCARVRKAGYICKIVERAWIHHEGHATFKANDLDINKILEENRAPFHRKHPKIKVIAITKDEIEALPGFVEQFKGITNDISILDSGSTDGTVEWAKNNGVAIIEDYEFTAFSRARNHAIGKFALSCDWIIMFDPDERLDKSTLENIWELVDQDEYDIFLAKLVDTNGKEHIAKPFMHRNKPDIRWVFPVHEKLIGSNRVVVLKNSLITHHLGFHDATRRIKSIAQYRELGGEFDTDSELFEETLKEYPILNYAHPSDPRIKEFYLGPKISVIIPTHKRVKNLLLGKAVASVLEQDYFSKEIIIVGDNCPELQDYACEKARIFNLPNNHGAGGAIPRNYGIMLSSANLIAYVDDDNTVMSDHLSCLHDKMKFEGASYALSSMLVDGKPRFCTAPEKFQVDTSEVLHKKSLIEKYGWWKNRTEVGYAHDFEMVSRWKNEKVALTMVPTLIYNAETSGQKEFLETTT